MQKIFFSILILSFLTINFGVLAQDTDLPSPGITPDSPFHFFDTLGEKIGMLFAFRTEKKAEKALRYAEEKLAEAKAMAEKNKIQALEKAIQKYQEFLGLANTKTKEAKEKGKDVEGLVSLIVEKTLKHQEVLLEVFEKVPEEAKTAIQKAIEVSRRGSEEAVQAVTGAKKEELQKKIEEVKTKVEESIKLRQMLDETADWKTYKNEKYGYSLKYPLHCFYGPMPVYCKEKPPEERPSECLCFLNDKDPDSVFLQAFTGKKDNLTLATLSVTHRDISLHNPPPGTDLIEWLKEKFSPWSDENIPDKPNFKIDGIPAVRVYTPRSPQAFSKAFRALREEVQEQIEYLDGKAGLTPEEEKVRTKLKEALDVSEEFISKELRDIEKELE